MWSEVFHSEFIFMDQSSVIYKKQNIPISGYFLNREIIVWISFSATLPLKYPILGGNYTIILLTLKVFKETEF
jgi:hypothetical protein